MASRVTKNPNLTGVEFASAGQPLRVAELDQDLDAIFSAIDTTNIAPNAGIVGTQIANATITATQLANTTITTAKTAVTVSTPQVATVAATAAQVLGVTDTNLAVLPSITTRGGRVLVSGVISGAITIGTNATTTTFTFKVFRDASVIQTYTISINGTAGHIVPLALPVSVLDLPSAAAHVYKVTGTAPNALVASFTTDATNPGNLFAVEFA